MLVYFLKKKENKSIRIERLGDLGDSRRSGDEIK